jgi:hypothetical protein
VKASAVLCLALLLAACSGNDTPEIEPAVRAYSDAYLAGDGDTAFALLTSRCQDRTDQEEFQLSAAAGKAQYGAAKMTSFEVVEQSGNLARVTYEYDQSAINQTQEPWALEDGEWRNDDC